MMNDYAKIKCFYSDSPTRKIIAIKENGVECAIFKKVSEGGVDGCSSFYKREGSDEAGFYNNEDFLDSGYLFFVELPNTFRFASEMGR